MTRFTALTIATLFLLAISSVQAAPASEPFAFEERGLLSSIFSPQAPAQAPAQTPAQTPAQAPAPHQPQPQAPARAPASSHRHGGDCGRPGDEQECPENDYEPDLIEAGVKSKQG